MVTCSVAGFLTPGMPVCISSGLTAKVFWLWCLSGSVRAFDPDQIANLKVAIPHQPRG